MPLLARSIYLTVFAILVCGGLSTTQTMSTLEDRRKALNERNWRRLLPALIPSI